MRNSLRTRHSRNPRLPLAAVLLSVLGAVACESPPPTVEQRLFAVPGARTILRAATEEERAAIAAEAVFLTENYGFTPSGDYRLLRNLRDLIDREEILSALHEEPSLSFGRALASIGYHLDPIDAIPLSRAAAGPPGEALADRAVRDLLGRLAAEDLLHPEAGDDLIRIHPRRCAALRKLAADPEGAARVRSFAEALPYRFRPSDAKALLEQPPLSPSSSECARMRELLSDLHTEARPGYLHELRVLAGNPDATEEWLSLARDASVRLAGPRAILALAAAMRDGPPPPGAERKRFRDLAGLVAWPDASDLPALALLARAGGVPDLVDALSDRYHYRFDTRDARGLLRLQEAGLPDPELPDWVVTDRVPIERPALLLSSDPATAFAGENDLAFMDRLARSRPELVAQSRDRLERKLARRLSGRPSQFRLGAPYRETRTELDRFLRPDLLKALLVLEQLDRPAIVALIQGWMDEDIRDRSGEMGGYMRLSESGRLELTLYEGSAADGRDDRLHLPPDPVGSALEFHFHATDEDDTPFAGPSSGGPGTDLFRAARHRLDGLVMTRLEGRRFNVDLYTSGETVLDLGVYGSPPSR